MNSITAKDTSIGIIGRFVAILGLVLSILFSLLLFGHNTLAGDEPVLPKGLIKAPREAAVQFGDEEWVRNAIKVMWSDRVRAGVTPLQRLEVPFQPKLHLYVKNEAKSPTGSLKHRVAWSLIMYGLIEGSIHEDTHLYEETSGNTGIGEAYFARMLGLPFTAVMRSGISAQKVDAIRHYGGRVLAAPEGVPVADYYAQVLAGDTKAYDLDQFANAEKAIDYFAGTPAESMNMANEIFQQLSLEKDSCVDWIVTGAGTGGTATSIIRYIRKWQVLNQAACCTKLAVVDPEYSVLFDWYLTGDETLTLPVYTRIEGIGSNGPIKFGDTMSLLRKGISKMYKVPDRASLAGMRLLSDILGFDVGPSSGTIFYGALKLLSDMQQKGNSGSVVMIVCDEGSRYKDKYFSPDWVKKNDLEYDQWFSCLKNFWNTGVWTEPKS